MKNFTQSANDKKMSSFRIQILKVCKNEFKNSHLLFTKKYVKTFQPANNLYQCRMFVNNDTKI